jgi:hypothetical protein
MNDGRALKGGATMKRVQAQNSKTRIAVIAAFLLLPFLSLSIWHWATATPDTEDKLQRIVEKYGYSAVAPPSRLFGPGTFTTVEKLSNGNLKLHPTCIMDDDILAAKWRKSRTVQESLFSAIEQTFASSAKALAVSDTNAAGRRVKGFDFSLREIYVVTMSDEGLRSLRNQYLKGSCEEVVIGNLRNGAEVCQSQEVLEADLSYKAHDEDELQGSVNVGFTGRATGSTGGDRRAKERHELRGKALFLGARIGNCFRLFDNDQIADNSRTGVGGF